MPEASLDRDIGVGIVDRYADAEHWGGVVAVVDVDAGDETDAGPVDVGIAIVVLARVDADAADVDVGDVVNVRDDLHDDAGSGP